MRRKGRPKASYYGRRATQADMALEASFYKLADGVVEWLDNGNHAAFSTALDELDQEYLVELAPLDPAAPKDERIGILASRYAAASKALSDFRLIGQLIEQRRDMALAELIATAAEPSSVPVYWQKLIKRIQAEGIVQPDVHPSSRALAKHVASSIRDFKAIGGQKIDENYSDAPLGSWQELPREFAGFRLIDIASDDPILAFEPEIHPLPPSPDIAFYTADKTPPLTSHTRKATFRAWADIIKAWAERSGREMTHQQPAIWAMLLAHRTADDNSDVRFFNHQIIESPWQRGQLVRIEVIEDDLPPEYR